MTTVAPTPSGQHGEVRAEGGAESAAEVRRREFDHTWDQPKGFFGIFATIDNIPIANRYMMTSFAFFIVGGLLALVMRVQLARPENGVVDPQTYNELFTMHGTTMIFLFVVPFVEAFANYLIPLLNGTRDLPFPRLTALSYWTYLFGGIFIYTSFLFGMAPDGGWFAYVPLNLKEYSPGLNMDFWDIGLSVAEVAAIGAAAEMIVGILRMRAPGMSLNRLPLFCWAMLVTSVMIIFAFTPLIVGTAMLELDRKELTRFFDARYGGDPLLWQHIFWVFGHPDVYIMFVPFVGVISHVIQTFVRRPVMSYTFMVLAVVATGFLSFGLWVHHMYTTGLSPMGMGFFAAASMAVAIPSGINVFGWIATIWAGKPVWRTPLLFALGGIVIFVVGGVTGVMVAAVPFDWQAHDTYFVVAHLHYVLFGGSIFPIFAGLYYWLPKFSGRMMSERLGRWNFWLMFVGFNLAFLPMHWSGLHGMPRRVYTYPAGLGLEWYNLLSTLGGVVLTAGVLLFLVNVGLSLRRGREAGPDPWGGDTLEWSEQSPPVNAQFGRIPVVRSRHPMWDQATLLPVEGDAPDVVRAARLLDYAPSRWRGSVVVNVLDGRPLALAHLPRRSVWPFVMSVGFTTLFVSALLDHKWLAIAGLVITAVALVGWFWPVDTEGTAIEEAYVDEARVPGSDPEDTRPAAGLHSVGYRPGQLGLPLAVGDRASNGYWGTCVLVVILSVAMATVLSAYFYLGSGPNPLPAGREPPPLAPALWATAATVLAAVVTRLLTGAADRRAHGMRLLTALAALVLHALFVWLAVEAYRAGAFEPALDGYDSSVLGVLGFTWATGVGAVGILLAAVLWAWRRPADPRGRGVALNASLVSYTATGCWLAALAVVYLWPRLA